MSERFLPSTVPRVEIHTSRCEVGAVALTLMVLFLALDRGRLRQRGGVLEGGRRGTLGRADLDLGARTGHPDVDRNRTFVGSGRSRASIPHRS